VRFFLSDPAKTYSNDFFPFFIAGMSIASYQSGQKAAAMIAVTVAILLDLAHLFLGYKDPSMPIGMQRSEVLWISAVLVFVASQHQAPKWLKPVAFIGLISYPMYLLHQDLGNMLLTWLQIPPNGALAVLMRMLVVPSLVILAGTAIFYLVERRVGKLTTSILNGSFYAKSGVVT
jgi:peptidoglycan/LPS O-acetylase OafA/YrhL